MSVILHTDNLCKRFGRTEVLRELALSVDEGSVYGLVGPNGAGKTTTVKTLMNIFGPSSGQAMVLGVNSRLLAPRHFQQIGYVSENQDMPEWMTVEYLMAYVKPFYPSWDDARASDLLEQFDLPRKRKLKHLSRGMRMKAALASSLAYRPKLLVLDEPFTGLDPLVRDELVEGLVESAEETTMLISSHDLAEIESFVTHIGFLDRGRLQFSEGLSVLSARFREIEVTGDMRANVPADWPEHWLQPETSGGFVRFIDSRFERERSLADVRRVFGDSVRVDSNTMSLRSIFVTLARESRKAA